MGDDFATKSGLCVAALMIIFAPLLYDTAQAQEIMSFEEYQSTDHPEPYIYQINTNSGALLYFGARHSFEPSDAQMKQLEKVWRDFKPDVAYTEGTNVSSIDSLARTQVIQRYGEVGLTWRLAHRDDVPVRSLDPNREDEVAYLNNQGWSGEQLMLFYTLRQVAQSHSQQAPVHLEQVVPQYLNSLAQRLGLKGPTTLSQFEQAVERLLPNVSNWKTIPMTYFYPGPQDPSYFTNEIATDSNRFRDRHHVDLLSEAVRSGKRVFVVAGSAHAVMQEPALRDALGGH